MNNYAFYPLAFIYIILNCVHYIILLYKKEPGRFFNFRVVMRIKTLEPKLENMISYSKLGFEYLF